LRTNTKIRNRRNRNDEKSYLFTVRNDLWKEIEETAYSLDVSIASFLRESARRNVNAYRKANTQ
jgi:hypothetical protein